MTLHRIGRLTVGVPDVPATAAFYDDFGLERLRSGSDEVRFGSLEGGEQLRLVPAPFRRLLEVELTTDDPDDCERIATRLTAKGFSAAVTRPGSEPELTAFEPTTQLTARVVVGPRVVQTATPAPVYNGPGRLTRIGTRSEAVLRQGQVRPRRLGHFVLGTTDFDVTTRFFVEGLGFKVSDIVEGHGVFLRCSEEHHNVLVQRAPVPFLHHTSWQVDDVDEIGRGAMNMLATDPGRHVWGLGRHYAGSNFFWYLKDPAGNFAEYHSDMDCVPDDALWTPEVLEGARGLFTWGPPPPPSFLNPEDLADLMVAGHS
jgi:catechol 2,3-dioxygenase-like lactoylglutathione lyase family enzyme